MKRFFLPFLIVFFTILLVGCNNQKPAKELYELQENCRGASQAWMKSHEDKFPFESFYYVNHYNKKMNKCFVSYISADRYANRVFALVDVTENKQYGSCTESSRGSVLCIFLEKDVTSKEEWDKLIIPYMEE